MNAKQFAWVYLINSGLAGCTRSYYGGYDFEVDQDDPEYKNFSSWDGSLHKKVRQNYIDALRRVGVNWDKTKSPKSDMISQFEGTFAESSQKEYLVGTLILNDGSEQSWIADAIDVSDVFEMMAEVSQGADKFEKIFQCKP